VLDCEQSLVCSKIPAGRTAKKRVRYSSGERRRRELSHPRYSRFEYRARGFAALRGFARILEQKRDCLQSNKVSFSICIYPSSLNKHCTVSWFYSRAQCMLKRHHACKWKLATAEQYFPVVARVVLQFKEILQTKLYESRQTSCFIFLIIKFMVLRFCYIKSII